MVLQRSLSGIARCLTILYPKLTGAKVVRAWAGITGFTTDGLPLVGHLPGAPRLSIVIFNGFCRRS
jgi:glycine/D-amino acid oxidase-like deaminating enzyme